MGGVGSGRVAKRSDLAVERRVVDRPSGASDADTKVVGPAAPASLPARLRDAHLAARAPQRAGNPATQSSRLRAVTKQCDVFAGPRDALFPQRPDDFRLLGTVNRVRVDFQRHQARQSQKRRQVGYGG